MDMLENYMLKKVKTAKQRGDQVYIYNGLGELVDVHDALTLAKAWFQMSNDAFFDIYGFSWVPKGRYYAEAKRQLGRC